MPQVPPELALEIYRRMLLIRRFDERVGELAKAGEIAGASHLTIGQEATVVGACLAVRPDDYMTGTHRSHGHPIAKGAEVGQLMAELLGRRTGICHGKGGSMHLADFSVGSLGETSIVGAGLPIAVGGGLSARLRGTDQVVLSFFGDGASNQGTFHESLNLAAVWKLPVIFVCENNGYALSTPFATTTSVPDISVRAVGHGIPGVTVDGMDPVKVHAAVATAVARARAGDGPSLVEAKTYRFVEHAEGLRLRYREEKEIIAWRQRDPVTAFRDRLDGLGVGSAEIERVEAEAQRLVDTADEFAHESPEPVLEDIWEDLYVTPGLARRGWEWTAS